MRLPRGGLLVAEVAHQPETTSSRRCAGSRSRKRRIRRCSTGIFALLEQLGQRHPERARDAAQQQHRRVAFAGFELGEVAFRDARRSARAPCAPCRAARAPRGPAGPARPGSRPSSGSWAERRHVRAPGAGPWRCIRSTPAGGRAGQSAGNILQSLIAVKHFEIVSVHVRSCARSVHGACRTSRGRTALDAASPARLDALLCLTRPEHASKIAGRASGRDARSGAWRHALAARDRDAPCIRAAGRDQMHDGPNDRGGTPARPRRSNMPSLSTADHRASPPRVDDSARLQRRARPDRAQPRRRARGQDRLHRRCRHVHLRRARRARRSLRQRAHRARAAAGAAHAALPSRHHRLPDRVPRRDQGRHRADRGEHAAHHRRLRVHAARQPRPRAGRLGAAAADVRAAAGQAPPPRARDRVRRTERAPARHVRSRS